MFHKAEKTQQKLWCAIYGASGSGKTMTALRIATGMTGKIAVIDTERGSAAKYSDRFSFDTCELENKTIAGYTAAVNEAAAGGYDILIIDSMSHAWQQLVNEIELLAEQKYKGNVWRAWSEGTPQQQAFINIVLTFPGHVIVTMRSKTEWSTSKDSNGKVSPQKVGLQPEQGKGIEYEFDMLLMLDENHVAHIEKDRTGKFQDQYINQPGEGFGKQLIEWLLDAKPAAAKPAPQPQAAPEGTSAAAPAGTPPPAGKPAERVRDARVAYFWGIITKAKQEAAFDIEAMKLLTDEEQIKTMRDFCMEKDLWQPAEVKEKRAKEKAAKERAAAAKAGAPK